MENSRNEYLSDVSIDSSDVNGSDNNEEEIGWSFSLSSNKNEETIDNNSSIILMNVPLNNLTEETKMEKLSVNETWTEKNKNIEGFISLLNKSNFQLSSNVVGIETSAGNGDTCIKDKTSHSPMKCTYQLRQKRNQKKDKFSSSVVTANANLFKKQKKDEKESSDIEEIIGCIENIMSKEQYNVKYWKNDEYNEKLAKMYKMFKKIDIKKAPDWLYYISLFELIKMSTINEARRKTYKNHLDNIVFNKDENVNNSKDKLATYLCEMVKNNKIRSINNINLYTTN